MNPFEDWTYDNKKVVVNGSMVACGDSVYSYQMCIAVRQGRNLLAVTKDESPTVTTSRHINRIRDAAEKAGLSIIDVSRELLNLR